MNKLTKSLIVIAVGVVIWFRPHPVEVAPNAWHLFAIVVATILGLILQPLPIGAVAFIGVTIAILTKTLSVKDALAGFGNATIWLIFCAFILARGFIKTGLGRRIAYKIISLVGDSTLKIGYGIVLSDLVISPAMPSSGARAGGILFPIVKGLSSALGSEPDGSRKRAGAFFMQTLWQGNTITNAMFLTSMAANPLIAKFAADTFHVEISWTLWALASLLPGLVSIALIPYLLYKIYPPEVKQYPEGKAIAKAELEKMGDMSYGEKVVVGVFVGA